MKLKVLIISIVIIFQFCKGVDTSIFENTKSDSQITNTSVIEDFVNLDSNHLNNYPMQTYVDGGPLEYMIGYNYKTHCLDIFNLTQKNIETIPLYGDGPNSINRDINGIYSTTTDSIWLYTTNMIYLLNNDGTIHTKHTLPVDAGEYIINTSNYSNASIKLHYNSERNSIFYVTIKMEDINYFYLNEFSFKTETSKKTSLEYTDAEKGVGKKYGWMQHPNITYNQNSIIYNFPFNSNIYTLDINSGLIGKHGGKSVFTKNISNSTNKVSIEDWDRHLMENIHFYEINYDPYRNCYYRLHTNGSEFNPKISFSEQLNNKRLFLTVFDEHFKLIKEIALNANSYNLIGGWGIIKDGFLIVKDNPDNENNDYEELQYEVISFTL